jgi:hypothetical protein
MPVQSTRPEIIRTPKFQNTKISVQLGRPGRPTLSNDPIQYRLLARGLENCSSTDGEHSCTSSREGSRALHHAAGIDHDRKRKSHLILHVVVEFVYAALAVQRCNTSPKPWPPSFALLCNPRSNTSHLRQRVVHYGSLAVNRGGNAILGVI